MRGFGIGSFVIVPLVSDGRCLGFMTCDERGERLQPRPDGDRPADDVRHVDRRVSREGDRARRAPSAERAEEPVRRPRLARAADAGCRDLRRRPDARRTRAQLTPEQRAELRRMLSQQSKRLLELVENLLDLSRLEADSIRIAPTRFEVRERVAANVAAVFGGDARVTIDAAGGPRRCRRPRGVRSDPVEPARERAPPRRAAVPCLCRAVRGRALGHDRGPGRGVAEEFVPSLFERFTRGTTRRERGRRARPLDRAVVRPRARRHATYEPAEPHGARFRLILPAGAPPAHDPAD